MILIITIRSQPALLIIPRMSRHTLIGMYILNPLHRLFLSPPSGGVLDSLEFAAIAMWVRVALTVFNVGRVSHRNGTGDIMIQLAPLDQHLTNRIRDEVGEEV